ncbi:MAG TPA: cytochrome P450 [Vicinamibacterales bacterium]
MTIPALTGRPDTPPARRYDSLLELRRARRDPIGFLRTLAAHGDVATCRFGDQLVVLLSHPDDIEGVLITHDARFVKPPALDRASRLLGQGLLTANGRLHAVRRRTIAPAFHRQRMERYAGRIVEHALARAARWRDGDTIDAVDEMTTLTLRVVGDCLFGADLTPVAAELRRLLATAIDAVDPLVVLVAPMRRLRPARARLLEIVEELIARQLADPRDNLLALLLDASGPEATAEQLRDDALTMLLAGHDTIANALTWTWSWLAGHPEAERRMHDELDQVLDGAPPGIDHVRQLPWTRAVLAESLRLTPPAWILARRAVEDHPCRDGVIPRGALVVMSPYLVHRDPRFHPDPDSYRPERWLDADQARRPKLAYFPFGDGRRSCIGESFAWMEGILVLATLAQRWRLEPEDPTRRFDPRITLRPHGPQRMRVRAR